jgi:hypothetical protein
MNMLTVFLHRKRKVAEALAATKGAARGAGDALELTHQVYGARLLVRGLLWVSIYLLSRGLLEVTTLTPPVRIAIALLPLPFFVWYLWTWMKGVAAMDELQRRIELEALGFAFPATLVFLMTVGLLDLAITLDPKNFSVHNLWLMLPMLYYVGLWRAKRRYL